MVHASPAHVHLIVGYLGAGKTTLVRRLTREGRWRVIVNDMATLNVDELLVRDLGSQQVAPGVVGIAGGCICCEKLPELLAAVQQSVSSTAVDSLTTGTPVL